MSHICFQNISKIKRGEFRPDRPAVGLYSDNEERKRATYEHEGAHEQLTYRSTTGMAAFICGIYKHNKEFESLQKKIQKIEESNGQIETLYPRYYESATFWVHEGVATACEVIHWSNISKHPREELLDLKPPDYREAALQFLNFVAPIIQEYSYLDDFVKLFLETQTIIAIGLFIKSPLVPDNFYSGALIDDGSYHPFLDLIPQRTEDVFSITSEKLGMLLKPIIEDFLKQSIEKSNDENYIKETAERLFRDAKLKYLKEYYIDSTLNEAENPELIVKAGDWNQFKFDISLALAKNTGLDYGEINYDFLEKEFGITFSTNKMGLYTDNGCRTHFIEPISHRRQLIPLGALYVAPQLFSDSIILPELAWTRDAQGFITLHLFDYDGNHKESFISEVQFNEHELARQVILQALVKLKQQINVSDNNCFGVVTPFEILETPLSDIVRDIPLIEVPYFPIKPELFNYDELVCVDKDKKGLVRVLLTDGRIFWIVVNNATTVSLELTNFLDGAYLWVLANGANAFLVWKNNFGGSNEQT